MTTNTAQFRRSNNQPSYQHMDRHDYIIRAHEHTKRGEDLPQSKLTAEKVRRLKLEAEHGARLAAELKAVSLTEIADKMSIGVQSLKRYMDAGARTRAMDDETCRLIDLMLAERARLSRDRERYTQAAIAGRYGITVDSVGKIVRGDNWGHVV